MTTLFKHAVIASVILLAFVRTIRDFAFADKVSAIRIEENER